MNSISFKKNLQQLQAISMNVSDDASEYLLHTHFRGWAYAIIRNLFINNIRKIMHRQAFIGHADNLYPLSLPQDSGLDTTGSAYDLKELRHLTDKLPQEHRILFAMHVSGFRYREIADKLGMPLSVVKHRIYLIRQHMLCIHE